MFGTMEVHVAVIEWESLMDPEAIVATDIESVQEKARAAVIETMGATVPEYDPDGCRSFVIGKTELSASDWLIKLHEITTVPWVTFSTHTIEIQ